MKLGWLNGLLILLLLAPGILYGAAAETEATATDDPQLPMSGIERFNVAHEYLSDRVENLSRRLDNFFGENRSFEESNDTYLQVRGSVILDRDETFFNGEFRAKFNLPNISEHLHFVLESHRDNEDPTDPRITTGDANLRDTLDESRFIAGLVFGVEEFRRWKLTVQPGLKVDDLDPTVRFRARRQSGLHNGWQNRWTLTPAWFESKGWEASVGFDLERIVLEDALLRSTTQSFWEEQDEDQYMFGQLLQFINPLNRDESLAYEIGVTLRTQPKLEDASYFGSVRYRRNIHQGWMFVELKPQLLFERDRDFEADPSLVLTLEVLIGGPYRDDRD